jgi:nucleoside-diphosphate-sugar epimerase
MLDYSDPSKEQELPLQEAVDRSNTILYLAANPDVVIGFENTRIDLQQNVQVTYNLLEAIRLNMVQKNVEVAERKKIQLTLASSSTVYGEAIVKPTPENLLSPFIQYHYMVLQNLPVRLLFLGITKCLIFNV